MAYYTQYYVLKELHYSVYTYFSVYYENFDDSGHVPGAIFDLVPNLNFGISPRKLNGF